MPVYQPVQECFVCEDDEVMFSADFSSLEDRASAIKTEDTNKIKIFADGFDAHSFKASFYFEDLLPPIDRNSVEEVLSIKKNFPDIRDNSKPITFGKTYGGGNAFLERKGYTPERIYMINQGWEKLTAESIVYEKKFKQQTSQQGYTRLLFGLKLHTPAMSNPNTPNYLVEKEGRTAYNAHTQCFGMLNTRAAKGFLKALRNAPKEIQESVRISNLIHDNIIGICKNKPHIIKWVNDTLIREMSWQDDEYINHDIVKMETEMEISHDWFDFKSIPNNASMEQIEEALKQVEESRKCLN